MSTILVHSQNIGRRSISLSQEFRRIYGISLRRYQDFTMPVSMVIPMGIGFFLPVSVSLHKKFTQIVSTDHIFDTEQIRLLFQADYPASLPGPDRTQGC